MFSHMRRVWEDQMSPLCLVVLSVTFLLPYAHSWLYAMWLLLVSRLVREVDGIRKERKNNADKI